MKNFRIFLIALMACVLFSSSAVFAQKAAEKGIFKFEIVDDNEVVHEFFVTGTEVITPSGNLLRNYKIKVPKGIMENISFGVFANKILGIRITYTATGEKVTAYGFLNKSGNLSINLHKNGAGNEFPNGW